MKERDYIIATNRAKITMALGILRDVLPANNVQEYGVMCNEISQIKASLSRMESRLFSMIEIAEEQEG